MYARSVVFALCTMLTVPVALADDVDWDGVAYDDEDLLDDEDDFDFERGSVSRDSDRKKKSKDEDTRRISSDFDEPVEDFDIEDAEESDLEDLDEPLELLGDFEDEDDVQLEAPVRKTTRAPAPKGPGPITLDVAGKEPLADNYPLQVVAVDRDAVVVELPVLLSRSRIGLESAYQLQADVFVGDAKVGHFAQHVQAESLAEFGPSFGFVKVLAPVVERKGEIRIVVKKAAIDGTGAVELFTRVTPYAL